jgi:hypothetical protein
MRKNSGLEYSCFWTVRIIVAIEESKTRALWTYFVNRPINFNRVISSSCDVADIIVLQAHVAVARDSATAVWKSDKQCKMRICLLLLSCLLVSNLTSTTRHGQWTRAIGECKSNFVNRTTRRGAAGFYKVHYRLELYCWGCFSSGFYSVAAGMHTQTL